MKTPIKTVGTCAAAALMSAIAYLKPVTTVETMALSELGYSMLIELESCRLEPYKCSADKWTNGVGNTNNVFADKKITEKEAAKDLIKNVSIFEKTVNDSVKVEIPQPVFDSMVLLSFNIGSSAFRSSTALKKLNAGDTPSACKWILPWNKITIYENGKKKRVTSKGLVNRRNAEYKLCMSGV